MSEHDLLDGPDLPVPDPLALLGSPFPLPTSDTDDSDIDSDSYTISVTDSDDLDEEIEQLKAALLSEPDCYSHLSKLGGAYQSRFVRFRDPRDNDQAIEYTALAVALSPDENEQLYDDLSRLNTSYYLRYKKFRDFQDLEKQIECGERALSIDLEGDSDMLYYQAKALRVRFWHKENHTDLEQAIKYCTLAISLTLECEEDPELLDMFDVLNTLYHARFETSSNPENVKTSIEHATMAVKHTPNDDPELPKRLRYLSGFYREAFYHSSNPTDLDQSIKHGVHASSILSEGDENLPRQLQDLSISYLARFQRLRDFGDLDKAMECNSRIISLASDDQLIERHGALTNLSHIFHSRFELDRDLEDLERGMEFNARAFSLATNDDLSLEDPELEPTRLNILGGLYFSRYEHLDDPNDLDECIEYSQLAVSLAPSPSSMASSLTNLGAYLHARWHLLGNKNDLEESIQYQTRAVSLFTPQLHPNLPPQLQNIGQSYLAEFHISNGSKESPILRRALDYMREACHSAGPPLDKFDAAMNWANTARKYGMAEFLDAYQTAMDLIPQLVWLGRTIEQRYQDIQELRSLAAEAASAAISAQEYKLALEWLEQGRSIVMNQNLMLQSPLDHLGSVDNSLAERLQDVATRLHQASSRARSHHTLELPSSPSLTNSENEASHHRQLAKDYDDLLAEARRLPGFSDFLKPKRAAELISAARSGPIAIMNLDKHSCDALIVLPGAPDITHIGLPAFLYQKAIDILSSVGYSFTRGVPAERGVERRPVLETPESDFEHLLSVLWSDVVKPIFDVLGYEPVSIGGSLPHITWCTTGPLSFLPLHAAGIYRDSEQTTCSSDYVISSYTPNLAVLLASSASQATSVVHSSILVIGQEDTPGHSRLPGTAQEVECICRYAGDVISCTKLTGNKAVTTVVLDAMSHHDWVHLACHAHQNVGDPTQSGFFLYDDTLDLASIMRRSFKNKGLAFLSACQTARGDEKLPDETVHLASGMLSAGYPSVIATMWSVWDEDAPFVADIVYAYLLKGGQTDYRRSARALHDAVLALRRRIGEENFERW
ncbi:hypothetical protein FRC11_005915, partial [Ceratobasidium sp. 423]